MAHDAHPFAAAAGRRFDEHRITDRAGRFAEVRLDAALVSGHDRHTGQLHDRPRACLAAHLTDRLAGRADKDQSGLTHCIGKVGVFRQETETGMDGLRAGGFGRRNDPIAAQVGFLRRVAPIGMASSATRTCRACASTSE